MKRSDDFGKRLAKPLFAVLLAMLVAITPTALAEAAPQADSKIPYIEYMMAIVEGAQNLKAAKPNERLDVPDGNAKRDICEEHYSGEFAAGKTIKVHAINKKVENAGNAPPYKALSYVGGDGFKGGLDAAWKGESVAKGVLKGTVQGTIKLGINEVGEKISKGIEKSSQDSLKNAYDHAREIRTVYSKGISPKSVDALQKMNLDRHLANTAKATHQTWANNISNALASNLAPDAVTDTVF